MLAHPTANCRASINTDLARGRNGYGTIMSRADDSIRSRTSRSTTSSIPQTRAALSTIASRTGCTSVGELADDAQDFARRRLLLQRFLEFLEQPHILDGDHRLIGEGFEQLDLRRGEGAHLDATCDQCSNEFPC